MMKRIAMAAVVLGSMFALSACGPSCDDACANAVTQCKLPDSFKATCVDTCTKNPDKCTNVSESTKCVADATSCDAIAKCPACAK